MIRSRLVLMIAIVLQVDFARGRADEPEWDDFTGMHQYFTKMFVRSPGFGVSRLAAPNIEVVPRSPSQPMKQVASHPKQASPIPDPKPLKSFRGLRIKGKPFKIESQNLIGLKEETPRVYLQNGMAALGREGLDHYETRPLSPTEAYALKKLRDGEKVVYSITDDHRHYLFVGGLYADQTCLKCHDESEGDLLGAFVYSMTSVEMED